MRYAVNQVRPFQLNVMLQGNKKTFIIMFGPLLDELIQFTYFDVHAFSNIKNKNVCRTVVSCSQDHARI